MERHTRMAPFKSGVLQRSEFGWGLTGGAREKQSIRNTIGLGEEKTQRNYL